MRIGWLVQGVCETDCASTCAACVLFPAEVSQDNKVLLSPKQMGEISRLLGLYSRTEQSASDAQASSRDPPVEELYTYLRDLQTRWANTPCHGLVVKFL